MKCLQLEVQDDMLGTGGVNKFFESMKLINFPFFGGSFLCRLVTYFILSSVLVHVEFWAESSMPGNLSSYVISLSTTRG